MEFAREGSGDADIAAATITTCGSCTVVQPISDDDDDYITLPPADRLVIPEHCVDIDKDKDEIVQVIGTRGAKVTRIAGLEGMVGLKTLILRSCLVSSMEGVETLTNLTKLELYDNQIEIISSIERLNNLVILDLSFNSIRGISLVDACPALEELYIAQNKLRKIEGLSSLTQLRILDLGANRIRKIEGLDGCTNLQSLWLGKNKITEIEGVGHIASLKILDVQHNRLTSIGPDVCNLHALEELYLAFNMIETVDGLPVNSVLSTVDLSTNKISTINGIEKHVSLRELWMTKSLLSTYEELQPLARLPLLECLYLEHSPIAQDYEYRKKLTVLIPTLIQLDANSTTRW